MPGLPICALWYSSSHSNTCISSVNEVRLKHWNAIIIYGCYYISLAMINSMTLLSTFVLISTIVWYYFLTDKLFMIPESLIKVVKRAKRTQVFAMILLLCWKLLYQWSTRNIMDITAIFLIPLIALCRFYPFTNSLLP